MLTNQDFENFANFALPLINNGKAESMSHVVDLWEAKREEEATLDDIRQGIADAEAGLGRPASEVFAEIRHKLGLNP